MSRSSSAPSDAGPGRPLLDKLGVKPGARVSVLHVADPQFLSDLDERGADVSTRRRKRSDVVFFGAESAAMLARLAGLEPYIERDGAIWVIYPRGRRDIREVDVIRGGLEAGFVDNKIARFSETHTAMRLVIPVARR
jgi:hypothetical protein